MKRPMLVCGIAATIICSALILFDRAFVAVPIISALVLFLYSLKKRLFKENIIIPTVCITAIICTLSFLAVNQTKVAPTLEFDQTSQTIYGKIITTPQSTEDSSKFVLLADKIGDKKVNLKIDITLSGNHEYKLYDYISITGASISIPTQSNGDYSFSQVSDGTLLRAYGSVATFLWESEKTPTYHILAFKELVCQKADTYMSTASSGLFKGMLFGDKADLSPATKRSFRSSGISHLLAVSGLHTSLWCGLILSLFTLLKIPKKVGNTICLCFLLLFCIVSAFTPSVIRASAMTAVVLIAPFFKRTPDSLNSLGGAVLLLLTINPYTVTNVSFQLSVVATLGVLAANHFSSYIAHLKREIKAPRIAHLLHFVLSSLFISCAACIFTLPITAYHFGVISLLAPLSNLLCIQLAFYGLVAGAISIALSFVNISLVAPVTAFLFKFTSLLLNILMSISSDISSLKICSVPVSKAGLIAYIAVIGFAISIAYCVHHKNKNKSILKATALICAIATAVTVFAPFLPIPQEKSITVFNVENGIHLLIKSGTHYAYVENGNSRLTSNEKRSFPQASSESLDYYVVSFLGKTSVENLSYIEAVHSPENIILSSDALNKAEYLSATIPENVYELNNHSFNLNNEITVEIVDTGTIKYAIIKCGTETAYLHLYGNADHTDIIEQNECNIAIFNGIPHEPPEVFMDTVAISIGDGTSNNVLREMEMLCENLYTTANDNDITIHL